MCKVLYFTTLYRKWHRPEQTLNSAPSEPFSHFEENRNIKMRNDIKDKAVNTELLIYLKDYISRHNIVHKALNNQTICQS